MVQCTEHLYDVENRLTKQASVLGDRTYTNTYAYNDNVSTNTSGIKDGSLKQMDFPYLDTSQRIAENNGTNNNAPRAVWDILYCPWPIKKRFNNNKGKERL